MAERDIIRSALIDAIGWQEGLADAYAHIPKSEDRRYALRQAEKYRKLLAKKFGIGTPDERLAAESEPVRIWPPAKPSGEAA